MLGELLSVRPHYIHLGGNLEVRMHVPITATSFSGEVLREERKKAIQTAILGMRDQLFQGLESEKEDTKPNPEKHLLLKPLSHEGIKPYETKNRFLRRLGFLFHGKAETLREAENSSYGNAYRGMTLGELLLYGAVADGAIVISKTIRRGDNRYEMTQLTSSSTEAVDYAIQKSKMPDIAERILYGLQLDTLFNLTSQDVIKSILMSPVVIRFAEETVNKHERNYYKANIGGNPLPYFQVDPPMNINEATDAFTQHTHAWSGIDVHEFLRQVTQPLQ